MLLATRIAFATVSAGRFWPCGRLGIGLLGLRVVTSFAVNRGIRNLFSRIWHYLATQKFDRRRRSFMPPFFYGERPPSATFCCP
jgi:hypothetical protein